MKKLSIVSYTNSQPYLFGLRKVASNLGVEISLDNPADCAAKLISGEANIGLVPVVTISEIPNAKVISDYGIAGNGPVSSVLLLSDVPIEGIEKIYLDYQSRTSVALIKILAGDHWDMNVDWISGESGFENNIHSTAAGLVIGDRALVLKDKFKHCYDLSEAWNDYCGLPFVFACWVSNLDLSDEFVEEFNTALSMGLNDIDAVVDTIDDNITFDKSILLDYLSNKIVYKLDSKMRKGMRLFLDKVSETSELSKVRSCS